MNIQKPLTKEEVALVVQHLSDPTLRKFLQLLQLAQLEALTDATDILEISTEQMSRRVAFCSGYREALQNLLTYRNSFEDSANSEGV